MLHRVKLLLESLRGMAPQGAPIPVTSGSAMAVNVPAMAVASIGAAPREVTETLHMQTALQIARDYAQGRFGHAILDQSTGYPMNAEGGLADTVDSAWHFGFWCAKNGPDWPRTYVTVRLEPGGSPDGREHARYEAAPDTIRALDLTRCIAPPQAIREALRGGLVAVDDASFHVVYFAESEGQPSMVRVSSHRAGHEMDHRVLAPHNGRIMPPPLKTKKGRPLLNRE